MLSPLHVSIACLPGGTAQTLIPQGSSPWNPAPLRMGLLRTEQEINPQRCYFKLLDVTIPEVHNYTVIRPIKSYYYVD